MRQLILTLFVFFCFLYKEKKSARFCRMLSAICISFIQLFCIEHMLFRLDEPAQIDDAYLATNKS